MTSPQDYSKHFIPLESDPELFTELIHSLGASKSLSFQDVYSIEDAELLSLVPTPVLALVLILPTTLSYEEHIALEDADGSAYDHEDKVIWLRQTINNACGFYAILHAIANSAARDMIGIIAHSPHTLHADCSPEPMSTLSRMLSSIKEKNVEEAGRLLEANEDLEKAYHAVAIQGSTAPLNAEDEVDYHYLCFVKSDDGTCLYELDGDRMGPIRRVSLPPNSDLLSAPILKVIKSYLLAEEGASLEFSLMALCGSAE